MNIPKQINHRDALGFWLNEFGLTGTVVEIGACFGGFARIVLSQWKGEQYYLVDPWEVQNPKIYPERQPDQAKYNAQHADCIRLAEEDQRVRLIEGYSVDASQQFRDNYVDCAYIDGNHSYPAVMADMDAWWPKVKIGGIMGGHDFQNKTDEGWWCEVERAVIRWASEHNKVFYVCPCSSWFIHKSSP